MFTQPRLFLKCKPTEFFPRVCFSYIRPQTKGCLGRKLWNSLLSVDGRSPIDASAQVHPSRVCLDADTTLETSIGAQTNRANHQASLSSAIVSPSVPFGRQCLAHFSLNCAFA